MKKTANKTLLLFILITLSSVNVKAQCDPLDPYCEIEDVPIDGGITALILGGLALGYKALRKNKEEKE